LAALGAGANAAVSSWHWGEGGKGAVDLAKAVVETCNNNKSNFRFLYDLNTSIEDKINIVSSEIYGANGIELSEEARKKVALYESQVCSPSFHPPALHFGFKCRILIVIGLWTSSCVHRENSIFLLH